MVPGELIASILCDDDRLTGMSRVRLADQPRIEVTEIGGTVWISAHQPAVDTVAESRNAPDIALKSTLATP